MGERSFFSVGVWVLIIFVIWIIAWIIAEAIPVFNNLLSLIVSGIAADLNFHETQANDMLLLGGALCQLVHL